jgi:hypothetical protein
MVDEDRRGELPAVEGSGESADPSLMFAGGAGGD